MQERYLGDIHDYFKFLFIKHLSIELNSKIGLNWFLVDPNKIGLKELEKNDGERRSYLNNKAVNSFDKRIIKELKKFSDINKRKISLFTNHTHLKEYINFFNKYIDFYNRDFWIKESLKHFKNEKIVFLDPDNGFSFKRKGRTTLKYVLPEDCKAYLSLGKIVIITQFQSFRLKNSDHLKNIINDLSKNDIRITFPILRNRTAPNTFYITITNKNNKIDLKNIYEKYARKNFKVELINVL